jgi:two-component system OmpR family response regulator
MRVLVVEDEPRLAASLKNGLGAEGIAVDVAGDGAEALWYAEENTYDVILLDIMLPVLSGTEVCRRLRERGNWAPVMMLTAKDGDWDQIDHLDLGADDYLTKPFSFDVLLARMRSLMRRGVRDRPVDLVVGDLVMSPSRRSVDRGQEPISLTAREMSLLEFLMRRAGEVVSKSDILGNVWDFDFEGDPNIVEVYIGRLRNKVDRPFDRADIETVRGLGYRLRSPS